MRKPNNWYQMDYYQQQEWRKAERDVDDAEYDVRMMREESDREQSCIRKQMNESRDECQREINDISNQLQEIIRHRDILRQALTEIVLECPNPKLPYGIRIVEIAVKALEYNPQEEY